MKTFLLREILKVASRRTRADYREDRTCGNCGKQVPLANFCGICGATFIGSLYHRKALRVWYSANSPILAEFGYGIG